MGSSAVPSRGWWAWLAESAGGLVGEAGWWTWLAKRAGETVARAWLAKLGDGAAARNRMTSKKVARRGASSMGLSGTGEVRAMRNCTIARRTSGTFYLRHALGWV